VAAIVQSEGTAGEGAGPDHEPLDEEVVDRVCMAVQPDPNTNTTHPTSTQAKKSHRISTSLSAAPFAGTPPKQKRVTITVATLWNFEW
jgi:hypothetical protein